MKNTQIKSLKVVVPKEIRLQVYKEALLYYINEGYEKEDESEGHYGEGLCLVLPCILWGLHDYMDEITAGEWDFSDSVIAFPELGDGIPIIYKSFGKHNKIKTRKELLISWISELEKY